MDLYNPGPDETSKTLAFEATCLSTDLPGMCVSVYPGAQLKVTRTDITMDPYVPVVGIIQMKHTPTRCVVVRHGALEGRYTGLCPSRPYLVSGDGYPKLYPSGFEDILPPYSLQVVGLALSTNVLMVSVANANKRKLA